MTWGMEHNTLLYAGGDAGASRARIIGVMRGRYFTTAVIHIKRLRRLYVIRIRTNEPRL